MLALLLAAAFSYTLHAKDVLQPPRPAASDTWQAPAPNNAPRDPLEVKLADGTTLRGWLYRTPTQGAPYVLFFYGSNEDLAHESNRLAWLRDTFHVNALCFDLPGYGYSTGSISVETARSAAVAEVDYVRTKLVAPTTPLLVYGWSIGTALAIHAAAARPVSGLILQAPPATAEAMEKFSSKHDVPWYGRGVVAIKADADVRQLYDGAAAIRGLSAPLLVIQGTLDDVVPIEQGRAVFASSPAAHKRFVEVPGAHHNDLRFRNPPASDALGEFLGQFPGRLSP